MHVEVYEGEELLENKPQRVDTELQELIDQLDPNDPSFSTLVAKAKRKLERKRIREERDKRKELKRIKVDDPKSKYSQESGSTARHDRKMYNDERHKIAAQSKHDFVQQLEAETYHSLQSR